MSITSGLFQGQIIFLIIFFILFACTFVFVIGMIFSPKLRAKIMGVQIKATKQMVDEHAADFQDMTHKVVRSTGSGAVEGMKDVAREQGIDVPNLANPSSDAAPYIPSNKNTTRFCERCGGMVNSGDDHCPLCGEKV